MPGPAPQPPQERWSTQTGDDAWNLPDGPISNSVPTPLGCSPQGMRPEPSRTRRPSATATTTSYLGCVTVRPYECRQPRWSDQPVVAPTVAADRDWPS